MADIRVTSTGKIFYRIDATLVAILCEALPSVFERIEPAPKPAHVANAASATIRNVETPEWNVGMSAFGRPTITLKIGRTESYYSGSVEGAPMAFKRKRIVPIFEGEGQDHRHVRDEERISGYDVPREILDQYRALCNRQEPSVCVGDGERARIQDGELAQRNATDVLLARLS